MQIERVACMLFQIARDESVRTLEGLAATLANAIDSAPLLGLAHDAPTPVCRADGLAEPAGVWVGPGDPRLELCRRIARRALRGSLRDPTRGATAFHRADACPAWSRELTPTTVIGPYLFYRK